MVVVISNLELKEILSGSWAQGGWEKSGLVKSGHCDRYQKAQIICIWALEEGQWPQRTRRELRGRGWSPVPSEGSPQWPEDGSSGTSPQGPTPSRDKLTTNPLTWRRVQITCPTVSACGGSAEIRSGALCRQVTPASSPAVEWFAFPFLRCLGWLMPCSCLVLFGGGFVLWGRVLLLALAVWSSTW